MTRTNNDDVENRREKDKSYVRKERGRDSKDEKIKKSEDIHSNKEQKPGARLYVENVNVSNRELEKLFSKFGPILETWSVRSTPRYAFVLFKHKDDAAEALEAMNGLYVIKYIFIICVLQKISKVNNYNSKVILVFFYV